MGFLEDMAGKELTWGGKQLESPPVDCHADDQQPARRARRLGPTVSR
jgi:hypothetical protein